MAMKSKLKIFHASDVHGSEKCFRKFLNVPKVYGVDVIIMGGDITGKMLVPIVEQGDGSYKTEYMGSELVLKSQDEVEKITKLIADAGGYPYICTVDEYDKLKNDPAYLDRIFKNQIVKRVEEWVNLAEERLKSSGVEVYIMPGNDDYPEIDEALNKSEFVINPDGKLVVIGGRYEMISTGYVNITPWKAPRDIPDEKLEEILEELATQLKRPGDSIFSLHAPPYNTPIDLAPLLDNTLKPVLASGELVMTHVGSIAVRKLIEKYQPLLGFHGHIHESKGMVKIGRTICLNAGSDYLAGNLQGAIVTLEDGKVKSYMFTIG
ncbi:MAG: metallophosphoesterase [Nitrososphaerota archaeon]